MPIKSFFVFMFPCAFFGGLWQNSNKMSQPHIPCNKQALFTGKGAVFMGFWDYFVIALAVISVLTVAVTAIRTRKPIKVLASSGAWGLGALVTLSLTGQWTGLMLALTPYTIGTAAIFGLPGVICMVATKFIWGI